MNFLRKMGLVACFLSSLVFISCGAPTETSDLKIVGGSLASSTGLFQRSVVSLLSKTKRPFCTGTIISEQHVLTAAHCVDNITVAYIGFGTNFKNKSEVEDAQLRKVTTQFAHQGFVSPKEAFRGIRDYLKLEDPINDIAILKFTGGIPAGAEVMEIAAEDFKLSRGDQIFYAGFGITGRTRADAGLLRYVDSEVYLQVEDTAEIITSAAIGETICSGDSGGPMFVIERLSTGQIGQVQQIGVASRGNCSSRAFHTDVTKFADWVSLTKEKIEVLEKTEELISEF